MANQKALALVKQLELNIMAYVDRCCAAARLVAGQEPLKLKVAVLACYTTAAALADSYPNPSVSQLAWENLAGYWFGKWQVMEEEAAAHNAATTATDAATRPHDSAPPPPPVAPRTARKTATSRATNDSRPRDSGTPHSGRPTP